MSERTITIQHKDDETLRYEVTPEVFEERYKAEGFVATTYADDQSEYVAPVRARAHRQVEPAKSESESN